MIFEYFAKNKDKIGINIMIIAILLAIFSFINPILFKVHIESESFYNMYYYSFVRILCWCTTIIIFFFFGFALFLKGGRTNDKI